MEMQPLPGLRVDAGVCSCERCPADCTCVDCTCEDCSCPTCKH